MKVKYIGYEIISVLRKFQSVETFDTPREIPRDSSVHVQVEAVKAGMPPESESHPVDAPRRPEPVGRKQKWARTTRGGGDK